MYMTDVTDETESETSKAYRALQKARESEELFLRSESYHRKLLEEKKFWDAIRFDSGEFAAKLVTTDDIRSTQNYIAIMQSNPNAIVNLATYTQMPVEASLNRNTDFRSRRFLTKMSRWPPMNIFSGWLLRSRLFELLMMTVIVCNSILVAVDQEIEQSKKTNFIQGALEAMDFLFLFMFVAEIMLKWLDNFTTFWSEGWNLFDFLITSVSLVAPLLDVLYPETDEEEELENVLTAVRYLRIIRILRSLNVVTRIHKIQLIWGAVLKTFTSLVFITSLMFIFFFIFAIMGVAIFDRFSKSHRPDIIYRKAFQSLPETFVTLFQLFTLDHWFELLSDVSKVMDMPTPTTFIMLWVLIGSFIFRNIFVGVMVNNFQVIRGELIKETQSFEKARKLAEKINIFAMNRIENEVSQAFDNPDTMVDWESAMFHTLEVMKAIVRTQSPTIWPRDTLFAHYLLLEALASNTDEKNRLLQLLDMNISKMNDE